MAGLNVSIAFFLSVVAICEVIRQVSKRVLPLGVYRGLVREMLRMLMEIGPWGGGFGPDVILTLLFIIYLIHGVSFDGASANPTVSLQEFLVMDSSFVATAFKLLVQFVGMEAAGILTTHYWSWELTDFHLIQNLMALDCSSSIHTSLYHGIFVEGVCSFFFHLMALKFQHSHLLYRAPVLAVTVTTLAYTAGPFTGAFFNPTLASMVTFHCSGNILQEYVQVYWLGPLTGMLAALVLYQGNIPRLFQKNLLYSLKSKYRTPKGKVVPGLKQTRDNGEGQPQLRTKPWS
ncbi:aquaporin-12-like [Trachemys scripta elegans]|uniref:aquaporin-12-like n=1 Tax=Trachemys scripta elegans TaxID=31138 RepID=UPI001555D034|nr:aquaporin-12-like [Trachemys scripta elegans]